MADGFAVRRSVIEGLVLPSRTGVASVTEAAPAARFVYRGDPGLLSGVLGVDPSTTPMRAEAQNDRAVLWLGPDEWLLLAADTDGPAIAVVLNDALSGKPASFVDIGHRQIALVVAGPRADALLNAGCPLDLDPAAFPVGMCTRTILAKAEIVLWRIADDAFRIEIARSFAPYVVAFLAEAMFGVT
jgi:sarcosine oxidase, subunit gamma